MGWIKIRAIRKEAVFSATIGETFNIETKTGKRFWNDPKFLISIPTYESSGGFVDTRLTIDSVGYPNFRVTNNGDFSSNVSVDIYVTEGDIDTITPNGNTWQKVATIDGSNRKELYTLNASNGYSVALPSSFGGNYRVFYSFKNTNFPRNLFGYTLSHSVSNRVLKVSATGKFATMKQGTSQNSSISINAPMFCGINFTGLTFGSTNDQTPKTVNGYFNINGTQRTISCIVSGGWGFQIFSANQFHYYAERNNARDFSFSFVRVDGNLNSVSSPMIQYYYCSKNEYTVQSISEIELNCLVVWGY
ncbi:MAG: hypothetical protein ACRCRT_03845 [Cetobacterium somerae]